MKTEFEAKILEIDVVAVTERLTTLGSKKIDEIMQRRYVYDLMPKKENSWIRLRTDGTKTTLAIKEIHDDTIDGTKELEITVDDFDKTHLLLERLGYAAKGYQENKRIRYELDGVEIDIDFWPFIPPYLEIEGRSASEVETVIAKLGFNKSQTTSINTTHVYKRYVIDIDSAQQLKF